MRYKIAIFKPITMIYMWVQSISLWKPKFIKCDKFDIDDNNHTPCPMLCKWPTNSPFGIDMSYVVQLANMSVAPSYCMSFFPHAPSCDAPSCPLNHIYDAHDNSLSPPTSIRTLPLIVSSSTILLAHFPPHLPSRPPPLPGSSPPC